jgi:carboxypeptidase family protein
MYKHDFELRIAIMFLCAIPFACSGTSSSHDAGPDKPALDERLEAGQVRAGVITKKSELLEGVDAHGWIGDFKLYNDRVAFVVQNIDEPRGWGPYGGGLLDADRVREAGQPGEELFEEMFLNIDLFTIYPTSGEVISDGSDGQAAVVRMEGEPRGIPLVDAALGGALQAKDVVISQDYILEPDSDYLLIRTSLRSDTASSIQVQVGDLIFNGDQTTDFIRGKGICDEFPGGQYEYFAGFSPQVCYLYTGNTGDIRALISIEGITPLVAGEGEAPGKRDEGDPLVIDRILIVGDGGMDSCLRILSELRQETGLGLLGGTIKDSAGNPEAGAVVLAKDLSMAEDYRTVNQAYSDQSGTFEMQIPAGEYQVSVHAQGRDEHTSVTKTVSAEQTSLLELILPEPARLAYQCTGQDRQGGDTGALPCKISLQAGHDADMHASVNMNLLTFGASGQGEFILSLGDWTVTLSHGWEYSIHRQNISVAAGETVQVSGILQHQVDTSGFIGADLHNHCTRSVDSTFEIKDKIASNICEGLDVVILTDHDCQADFTPYIQQLKQELDFDLDNWTRFVTGNEVSPMYAHSTVFPLPTHPSGWIFWQIPWTLYEDGVFVRTLEYPEIISRARELGAEVINFAHPLANSGYFSYLGFDPPETIPRMDSLDPSKFSPDFDTLEVLNSSAVNDMLTKILPMWNSMNNQGFFRTAVGVSDAHHRSDEAGFGRTMVASSADDPINIDLSEIWTNLKQRRAMVAGGIFVRISIGEGTVGDLVSASGTFDVNVKVEAADWVPVEEAILIANGETVQTINLEQPGVVDAQHPAVRFDDQISVSPQVDTWYAVAAYGPANDELDPVFRGSRAVGLTNAVQVDVDGNGQFDPIDK